MKCAYVKMIAEKLNKMETLSKKIEAPNGKHEIRIKT